MKKVVAVCFLEAAKTTLEHLGAYRLELSQVGSSGPADLARYYGEVRRLRDYLQRCASAYQDQVELDLADADRPLLVACCRRAIEVIDARLSAEQACAPDERQWLQRKRQVIADWAVELATKPLLELPLRRVGTTQTEPARLFLARLHAKVFGDVNQRTRIVPPGAQPTQQISMIAGLPSLAAEMQSLAPPDEDDERTMIALPGPLPAPTPSPTTSVDLPSVCAAPSAPAVETACGLVQPKKLRDPRLRALVACDLRSYERAVAAGDYRVATVLLASVLESAMLDHAIPRRAEFSLAGTPDTWNPQELLLRVLGDQAAPKDRALAYHLFAARNLLRPAVQMTTPIVVTASSLEKLTDLVERALHAMGFKNSPTVFSEPAAAVQPAPVAELEPSAAAGPISEPEG